MSGAGTHAQVPIEILQRLEAAATQLGIELPTVSRFAPTIDVGQPIHTLALEVGRLIAARVSSRGEHIFLHGDAVVTVCEKTGKMRGLSAGRMCGAVEEFAAFTSRGRSNRLRDGLTREDAALILEQDVFRDSLRTLEAVHLVRLPTMGADGKPVLLPAGYDEASGIFTCDLVPYPRDWTKEQARAWMLEVNCELPWNGKDDMAVPEGGIYAPSYEFNRSLSVHVAAMMGTFCRAIFPTGTLRPMFAYFGNKPGTGKTRLAEMANAHVHGFVTVSRGTKDEEKLDVKLETVARTRRPYFILDDIGNSLRSNSLNNFITATVHGGRCFGKNDEFFEVPNVTQIFVTANDLQTSEDLGRRALVAELFLADEVRGRKFKRVITPSWLAQADTRANFLAACWALVRNWVEGGSALHWAPLETFEVWTGTIAGMVIAGGFADPLAKPEMDVGGASTEDELRTLLIKVATVHDTSDVIGLEELVMTARKHELWENVVGATGDPEPDGDAKKRIGRQMQRWRGQNLTDEREPARRFQFGHKRKKSGATYPLSFFDADGKPIPPPRSVVQSDLI